jgi:hypothetical protein
MAARKPPERPLLEVLKAELLGAIEDARAYGQPAAVASLSKELRAVQAELDGVTAAKEVSVADELSDRRAARRSVSPDRAPATRRGQPRRSNGSHRAS